MRQLYVYNALSFNANRPTKNYFSPAPLCPTGTPYAVCEERLGEPTDGSVWYRPMERVSRQAADLDFFDVAPPPQDMWARAPHLDNILRTVYFSSSSDALYLAFAASQEYVEFPYSDLSSLNAPQACDARPSLEVSSFNPLCRPWFFRAARSTEAVISPPQKSATNGGLFCAISEAIRDGDTEAYAGGGRDAGSGVDEGAPLAGRDGNVLSVVAMSVDL